jgi:hypothetical protein
VDVIAIDELLRGLGLADPDARAQARAILERHGLTGPRKVNMAVEKVPLVRALLAERAMLRCGDPGCAELGGPVLADREMIIVEPAHCTICAGSGQRRAALLLARDMVAAGRTRLLLIGGTPHQHHELAQPLAEVGVELRAGDGLKRGHSTTEAARQAAWADVIAIWAATPVKHKVTQVYTDAAPSRAVRVMVARRGLESLCADIRAALARGN